MPRLQAVRRGSSLLRSQSLPPAQRQPAKEWRPEVGVAALEPVRHQRRTARPSCHPPADHVRSKGCLTEPWGAAKPSLTNTQRREVADHYLRLVGLERFQHAYVHELSGGMKQRVALARSLAPDPQVLLMDEPFAALDALTRDQLYDDIQRIWQESRKTIVSVTHNVREAVCLGDRVVLMATGPGRISQIFDIPLPRPRDINSPELADYASQIAAALKGVTGGAASE